MKKFYLLFIVSLFIIFQGCTANINNSTKDVVVESSKSSSNSIEELSCIDGSSCKIIEKYINALNQECHVVVTSEREKQAYCKSKDNYWKKIKIL